MVSSNYSENDNMIYSMVGYNNGPNGVIDKVDISVIARNEKSAIEKARRYVERQYFVISSVRFRE